MLRGLCYNVPIADTKSNRTPSKLNPASAEERTMTPTEKQSKPRKFPAFYNWQPPSVEEQREQMKKAGKELAEKMLANRTRISCPQKHADVQHEHR